MTHAATRVSVLQRARSGDATEFVRIYSPIAYRIARKFGVGEHDAEDLMQQTMLELLQKLPTFQYEPAHGSFRGLLKTIVRHRVTDLLRSRQRCQTEGSVSLLADGAPEMDDVFEREWQKSHLLAALDRVRGEVKPTTFQSFQLAVLERWPNERVARTLGLTLNQVSQNKRRVIQRIREHVEEMRGDSA